MLVARLRPSHRRMGPKIIRGAKEAARISCAPQIFYDPFFLLRNTDFVFKML
jgi:hypothetical protein